MLCARCGYDRRGVYVSDPYAPCPECGDAGHPGELQPWPSPLQVGWRLLRFQFFTVIVTSVLILATARSSHGLDLCMLPVLAVLVFAVVLCLPFAHGGALAVRHCPEVRRTKVTLLLVLIGWAGGVAIVVIAYTLVVLVASLMR
jgi:hypothetical protein